MQSIIDEARYVSLATQRGAAEMVEVYLKDFYSSMDTALHALTALHLQHKAGESALHAENRQLEKACEDYECCLENIEMDGCEQCVDMQCDVDETQYSLEGAWGEIANLKKKVLDLERRLAAAKMKF